MFKFVISEPEGPRGSCVILDMYIRRRRWGRCFMRLTYPGVYCGHLLEGGDGGGAS